MDKKEDWTSGEYLSRMKAPLRRKKKSRRRGLPSLRSWKALPAYLQDNEFIRTGYRAELSLAQCLMSLFSVHNETGNVWSHLIGTTNPTAHHVQNFGSNRSNDIWKCCRVSPLCSIDSICGYIATFPTVPRCVLDVSS